MIYLLNVLISYTTFKVNNFQMFLVEINGLDIQKYFQRFRSEFGTEDDKIL